MGTGHSMSGVLTGRQSTYNTISAPRSSGLRTLQLLVHLIFCIIPSTHMLQEYEFRLGSNATITFNHRLTFPRSIYVCELFALNSPRPFFLNGQLDDTSLKSSQRGRFEVNIDSSDNNIDISLCIKDIQKDDSDVYIVNLRESSGGINNNKIYDAYIEVTFPPGKAYCNIHPSEYDEWSEVHCHAESGSADGRGSLLCFQDGFRAPHLQPVLVGGDQIRAVFWVRTNSQVTCCSAESDTAAVGEICRDFIYRPQLGKDLSDTFTSSAGSTSLITLSTESSTQQDTSMGDFDGLSIQKPQRNTVGIVLGVLLAVSMLLNILGFLLQFKRKKIFDIDRTPIKDATIQHEELAEPTMPECESSTLITIEQDSYAHQVQSSEMSSISKSNIQSQPPSSPRRKALPLYDNHDNEKLAKPVTSGNETPSFLKREKVGSVGEGPSPNCEMSSTGGSLIRNRTPRKGHPSSKTKICLQSRFD